MAGLLTNANYINDTIKPAIKSAIEAQGVTVPSTDSFLDYADRIGEIEGGGSGYQLKDLPSGAISTVSDAAELPLNALKVSVEAVQSGSGTPSPSNVRPITGWNSGEITVCDDVQNPTQTETASQQFPTTIYGAEWDVVGGGINKTKGYIGSLGADILWQEFDTNLYIAQIDTVKRNDTDYLCSCYKPTNKSRVELNDGESTFSSGTGKYLWVRDDRFSNVQDFVTAIRGQQLVFTLETPTTIDLSPLSIRLLEGTNNLYADCGDVIEGEYFVDEGAIDVRKVDYSIGSNTALKISDGRILQGFASMSGYHARPLDASGNWLDVDWSKDFEIGVAFKFTAFPTYQSIFGDGNANSYRKAPRIYYDNSESKLALCVSSDGSTLAIDTYLNHTFVADKWYFIKAKFVLSTMTFTVDISDDFSSFTSLYSGVMASAPYHDTASLSLGGEAQQSNMASNTFLIDTFNTYIKGDGVSWGTFTGAFPS